MAWPSDRADGKSRPVSLGKRVSGIPVRLKMEETATTRLIGRCIAPHGDQHWCSNKDVQWREKGRKRERERERERERIYQSWGE